MERIEEVWVDVIGYNGFYHVSNLGRIRSADRYVNHNWDNSKALRKGIVLKQSVNKDGYLYVTLCNNGKHKTERVHRVVAQHFCKNPYNKPHINHKNSVRDDNRAWNLEWVTPAENVHHSFLDGNRKRESVNKGKPSKSRKKVYQYSMDGEFLKEYSFSGEASKATGINFWNIANACASYANWNSSGGFIWSYNKYEKYPL